MRILDWNSLSAAARLKALSRPAQRHAARSAATARRIIARVRREGDAALLALTEQYDGARLRVLRVTPQEFAVRGTRARA